MPASSSNRWHPPSLPPWLQLSSTGGRTFQNAHGFSCFSEYQRALAQEVLFGGTFWISVGGEMWYPGPSDRPQDCCLLGLRWFPLAVCPANHRDSSGTLDGKKNLEREPACPSPNDIAPAPAASSNQTPNNSWRILALRKVFGMGLSLARRVR